MAVSLVQQTAQQSVFSSNTLNFNFGSNITASNMVVLCVTWYQNTHTLTVTAAGVAPSYTYNMTSFNIRCAVYVWENSPGGSAAITISSSGTSWIYASALEFSGLLTSSSFDVVSIDGVSSVVPTSGNTGTLAQAENLAISWTQSRNSRTPSQYAAPTGWTLSNLNIEDYNNATDGAMSWFVTSSTTALAPVWTGPTSSAWQWRTRTLVIKAAPPTSFTDDTKLFMGMHF